MCVTGSAFRRKEIFYCTETSVLANGIFDTVILFYSNVHMGGCIRAIKPREMRLVGEC